MKVIVRKRQDHLITRIVNDTRQPFNGLVEVGWWKLDGSHREVDTLPVSSPPNSMVQPTITSMIANKEHDPRIWLYAAVLRGEDGSALDQSIWNFLPHRQLALSAPQIRVTDLSGGIVEVSSPVYCHAVHIEDHGRDLISDNWFDLLPGVPVHLQMIGQESIGDAVFSAVTGSPIEL